MANKLKPIAKINNKSPINNQIDREIKEWKRAKELLDNSITIMIKDNQDYKTYKVLFYDKRIYIQYDAGAIKYGAYEYIEKDKILRHLYSVTKEVHIYKTFMIFRLNKNKKFISDHLANIVEYLKGI